MKHDPKWIAYSAHCRQAQQRRIAVLLTFEQWLKIWVDSGHWNERGCHRGQYVMARFGDKGNYELGNVKIIPHSDNIREKVISRKTRKLLSKGKEGERNGAAKLTTKLVIQLRKEYRNNPVRGAIPKIARKFNIKYTTVYDVVKGYKWKHIP